MQSRLLLLCAPVIDHEAALQDQLRSLIGLLAVYLGNLAPASATLRSLGFEATREELTVAAKDVALELLGGLVVAPSGGGPRRVGRTYLPEWSGRED